MLVGMIGAPGAGKTTLALGITLELKKRGYPAIYLEEYATRHILLHGIDEMTVQHQEAIEREQTRLEVAYNDEDRIVICDSSLWLNHFYMCRLLGQKDYYASNAEYLKQHYGLLFYVPPNGKSRGAVGRLPEHQCKGEQAGIDRDIHRMCIENGIEYQGVKASEVREAVNVILGSLDYYEWMGRRA